MKRNFLDGILLYSTELIGKTRLQYIKRGAFLCSIFNYRPVLIYGRYKALQTSQRSSQHRLCLYHYCSDKKRPQTLKRSRRIRGTISCSRHRLFVLPDIDIRGISRDIESSPRSNSFVYEPSKSQEKRRIFWYRFETEIVEWTVIGLKTSYLHLLTLFIYRGPNFTTF